MRRINAAAFVSLDGVMQAPGGPSEDPTGGFDAGGWVFGAWDPGLEEELGRIFDSLCDLLYGRRTYDIFAAYWPYVSGEEAAMGEAFTQAGKYVLSCGTPELDWANSHHLRGIAEVAALKETDGPDLLIQGSSTLYPPLLAAGLIDRLTLMIYPLLLGPGKRLFGEGTGPGRMEPLEQRVTAQGTIIATYGPGGPLPAVDPSAHPPSTSQREAARQRAMANGLW